MINYSSLDEEIISDDFLNNNQSDFLLFLKLNKSTLGDNKNISLLSDDTSTLYPLTLVIPITAIYAVIFLTGLIGNVSTCIVIARNRSMHTATNYYLFSLAVSDLLLLISGLPPEMYRIWSPETYEFGEFLCIFQGFAAETSANATVLTITAFTVERYVAICHPFLSHTLSKLSRAIRYIVAIWIVALFFAAPQAIQFGVEYGLKNGMQYSHCTVVSNFFNHYAFEISTFVFFVGPMTLITVLYILIGIQLRKSRVMAVPNQHQCNFELASRRSHRNNSAQNKVIKMLIAVVVAFFICWAPFHAQRLLAIYLFNASEEAQQTTITLYMIIMHTSGVLYFLSTTINPVLYHIMSNKFRDAFKKTLPTCCMGENNFNKTKFHSSRRSFQRTTTEYQLRNPDLMDNVEDALERDINIFSRRSSKIFSVTNQPATLSVLSKPEVMAKTHQIFNQARPEEQANDISSRSRTLPILFYSRKILRKEHAEDHKYA